MEDMTISEGFRKVIRSRQVRHAFFTTYCLEPDFFELEVLPLLLGNPALSSNEAIRYVQLQSMMGQHQNRYAIAYDADVFFPNLAARLEVDYLPIRQGGACQHAKIAVLELFDNATNNHSLVLAAGSFNLTKAGWWENIEVGHWVELHDKYAPKNIIDALSDALNFFGAQQASAVLSALRKRLDAMVSTPADSACSFYFSHRAGGRRSLVDFIASGTSGRDALEIVSPFFAKDGKAPLLTAFMETFKSVSLLLPADTNGDAPIATDVYDDLSDLPVTWCDWRKPMLKKLQIARDGGSFRKLHAKIYQCLGPKPWIFLGSVNLSYKAFAENVEAGFLLQGAVCESMLEARDTTRPTFAAAPDEAPLVGDESHSMPVVRLVYDWQESSLQARSSATGTLTLCDSNGDVLVTLVLTEDETLTVARPELKSELTRSSLLNGLWQTPQSGESVRRSLMVSQCNLYCRPNTLPAMGIDDLLRIFQDMHGARRIGLMAELAARMIRLQQDGVMLDENAPPLPGGARSVSFFAEFAQVNGAFWMLGKRLAEARDAVQRAYYLKGCQPDSLRGVLMALLPDEHRVQPSLIVRYLTLLSVSELLDRYPADADAHLAQTVAMTIATTEQEPAFRTIGGEDPDRFLAWIKEKFRQPIAGFDPRAQTIGVPHADN